MYGVNDYGEERHIPIGEIKLGGRLMDLFDESDGPLDRIENEIIGSNVYLDNISYRLDKINDTLYCIVIIVFIALLKCIGII